MKCSCRILIPKWFWHTQSYFVGVSFKFSWLKEEVCLPSRTIVAWAWTAPFLFYRHNIRFGSFVIGISIGNSRNVYLLNITNIFSSLLPSFSNHCCKRGQAHKQLLQFYKCNYIFLQLNWGSFVVEVVADGSIGYMNIPHRCVYLYGKFLYSANKWKAGISGVYAI